MDLDAMKSIVAIAKYGSISKAASHLHITQSALSRRIKALEEHYGCCFLDRSVGPGTLTAAGKMLLDRARGILRIEQELIRDLSMLGQKGGISFACTMPFGISFLPDILKNMVIGKGGGDEFKFVFKLPEEILEMFRRGSFDLAVVEHDKPFLLDGLYSCNLPTDEVAFISAPHLRVEESADIGQLLRYRLYCKQGGSCSRILLDNLLQPFGESIESFSSRVFFDDFNFLVGEVTEGKGISFMPLSIVRKELEAGSLVAWKAPGQQLFRRARTLITLPDQVTNSRLEPFIRRVFAAFQVDIPEFWDFGGKTSTRKLFDYST